MFKAAIELGRINSQMVVKFNIILDEDDDKSHIRTINKFTMRGNTYLNITPHPWISIDIGGRRRKSDDEYDPNNSVALTRPYVINVCRMIERAIESMSTEDLFFYRDGLLYINKEVASRRCLFKTSLKVGKYVAMCPMVINDGNEQYEGLGFLINTTANFAAMTLDEAGYLLDLLRNTDMNSLSLSLLNSAMHLKNVETRTLVRPETLPVEIEPIVDKHLRKPTGENPVPDLK